MLTNQSANQQRSSKETLKSPRSILRNPLKPKSRNESSSESRLYIASGSSNNPDPRPRSVIGFETRRLSLTDSDTSHGAARTRHSVADLRTLIRNGFSINPNDLTGSLSKSGSRIWSSGSILSGSGGMLDLDGCELEEVDSGVGEDPWCQYKSLIQKKKHLIFEEYTSWLNNILVRRNYQPVTDLCRSIRDGVTLVNLVQILTNAPVAGVCRQPVQQAERVENLQNCIRHLELHDVDTQGVTGLDLADGNLKSTLILMNNLRKKYENYQAYPPRQSTEACVNGDGSQSQQRTFQICNKYQQPSPQLSGSNRAPAQLANCNQSSSSSPIQLPTSVQFSIATSQSVNTRKGASSPHRTTPQSQIAYNPGSPSHRQDTQPTNSQSYQTHMNLIPGVIMDETPPARPPLPQDVIRSSPKMTNVTQHENRHELQMTSQPVPCSLTNELWAVHCRQAQYRQPTTSDAYRPPLPAYRPDGPTSHRPLVSDGCGLPISDSCRRLGPIITAQSVSQSMSNPSLAYTGRSTSVTPSVLSNAWSKSSQFLDSATVQQERTTNQRPITTKSTSEQRSLPPKLFGHFNAGYEHDGTELIVPPKPRQGQEVAANQNKIAYVPSHPSERPNCVPRLPAQMPNLPTHAGVQQPNQRMSTESPSHQPPPVYNPPPQYTRTYIQRQPQSDKSAKSSQGHPAQTIQSAMSNASLRQVGNSIASYPNSSQTSNQRYAQDYASGQHAQMTPSPAHRNTRPSPQQPNSHGTPASVTVTPVTTHRAVPANGRASPQGQSSTPASQSPCHDKILTSTCSQQNFVNVNHVTNTAKYSSQVPIHTYQGDFVKGTHDANVKNTDSAFIGGQIPPSSVYPTNGTGMGRAACIDFPEEQLSHQDGAWTKPSSPRYNQGTTMASTITLQQDVEALYSVVRKHRQEQTNPQMAPNRNGIEKANNKPEKIGNKSLPSPTRASNHGMPPPDADDWNSDDSSITPPLPPLSPSNSPTPPGSPPKMQQHTNRVLEMPSKHVGSHRKGRRSGSSARSYETGWRRSGPGRAACRTHARTRIPVTRNINDIDSVDHCSTSNLSDGDDWEDVITSNEVQKIHQQMEGLEMMYTEILKILGLDKEYIPGSRRSISSLSSISRSGTRRTRSNAFSHRTSREIRNMNKRFNRLEAHVVTLARSVAHLSSEMYAQNALKEELNEIRRDLKQLKKERHQHHSPDGANVPGTGLMAGLLSAGHADSRRLTEFEKFRGWIPSITNPKRVKKLAKFFGEDRLLQYFLEKLGYQKYIKNFRAEEITILELPYMSEERLEKLGIPMGPRQRILQEAQMCFRQENFNIYIV